jgi:hypothetical protein
VFWGWYAVQPQQLGMCQRISGTYLVLLLFAAAAVIHVKCNVAAKVEVEPRGRCCCMMAQDIGTYIGMCQKASMLLLPSLT